MRRLTMRFALPETVRRCNDERVRSGACGNTSAYLHDLSRRDQEAQAAQRLRALIDAKLAFGPATPLTSQEIDALGERLRGAARGRPA